MTDVNKDVVVGDLTSDAPGSGARKNGGKPDYGLLPLEVIFRVLEGRYYVAAEQQHTRTPVTTLSFLADWQRLGAKEDLLGAFHESVGTAADHGYWNLEMFREAAEVLAYGKGKYAPWNWAKGMPWSIPFACAIRHLIAISKGEDTDPESGCSHWGHVQANILMLLLFSERYPELNDMPFAVLKSPCGI